MADDQQRLLLAFETGHRLHARLDGDLVDRVSTVRPQLHVVDGGSAKRDTQSGTHPMADRLDGAQRVYRFGSSGHVSGRRRYQQFLLADPRIAFGIARDRYHRIRGTDRLTRSLSRFMPRRSGRLRNAIEAGWPKHGGSVRSTRERRRCRWRALNHQQRKRSGRQEGSAAGCDANVLSKSSQRLTSFGSRPLSRPAAFSLSRRSNFFDWRTADVAHQHYKHASRRDSGKQRTGFLRRSLTHHPGSSAH